MHIWICRTKKKLCGQIQSNWTLCFFSLKVCREWVFYVFLFLLKAPSHHMDTQQAFLTEKTENMTQMCIICRWGKWPVSFTLICSCGRGTEALRVSKSPSAVTSVIEGFRHYSLDTLRCLKAVESYTILLFVWQSHLQLHGAVILLGRRGSV